MIQKQEIYANLEVLKHVDAGHSAVHVHVMCIRNVCIKPIHMNRIYYQVLSPAIHLQVYAYQIARLHYTELEMLWSTIINLFIHLHET